MLDFVLYMVFSILEAYAMFYLAFKVFKIDIYSKEMLFAGFILAFFSYVVRINYSRVEVDIIMQYCLFLCFFWLLFRIHIFYSAILTGMTYQAYTFIQLVYALFFNKVGVLSERTFLGLDLTTYFLQLLTASTAIFIGYYVGYKRKGFDYVPDKPNGSITISKREKLLFILNLPTVAVVISIVHFFNSGYFLTLPLLYFAIMFCYIYLSYKKDRSGHEYTKF